MEKILSFNTGGFCIQSDSLCTTQNSSYHMLIQVFGPLQWVTATNNEIGSDFFTVHWSVLEVPQTKFSFPILIPQVNAMGG